MEQETTEVKPLAGIDAETAGFREDVLDSARSLLPRYGADVAEHVRAMQAAEHKSVGCLVRHVSALLEWAEDELAGHPTRQLSQVHIELSGLLQQGTRLLMKQERLKSARHILARSTLQKLRRAVSASERRVGGPGAEEVSSRLRDLGGFVSACLDDVASLPEIRSGLEGVEFGLSRIDRLIGKAVRDATPRTRWNVGRLRPFEGAEDVSFGVILKPGDVEKKVGEDLQGDISTQEEIDACLEDLQDQITKGKVGMGLEHAGKLVKDLKILGAGKLAHDMEVDGELIPQGSLIVKFAHTGEIGKAIRRGDYGGISLEAEADREPLATRFRYSRHGVIPHPLGRVVSAVSAPKTILVVTGQRQVHGATMLETWNASVSGPGPWVWATDAIIRKAEPVASDVDPAIWTSLVGIMNVNRKTLTESARNMTASGSLEASDLGKAIQAMLDAFDRMEKAYDVQQAQETPETPETPQAEAPEESLMEAIAGPGEGTETGTTTNPFEYGT